MKLRDPDGNLIEISSALAEDSWSNRLREATQKWDGINPTLIHPL